MVEEPLAHELYVEDEDADFDTGEDIVREEDDTRSV